MTSANLIDYKYAVHNIVDMIFIVLSLSEASSRMTRAAACFVCVNGKERESIIHSVH